MNTALAMAILEGLRERSLVCPREFLHLGTRAAVDQTLSRLHRAGKIRRVARGVYRGAIYDWTLTKTWLEITLRFADVVEAMEFQGQHDILPSGEAEARALELIPPADVPMGKYGPLRTGKLRKEVLIRYGRRRKAFTFLMQRVEIRSAPRWQIVLGRSPAGQAARALGCLPRGDVPKALQKLRSSMSEEDWGELSELRKMMPGWLAREVSIAT